MRGGLWPSIHQEVQQSDYLCDDKHEHELTMALYYNIEFISDRVVGEMEINHIMCVHELSLDEKFSMIAS